jgi:hypothetical protein
MINKDGPGQLDIRELARIQLGIEESQRLEELAELGGLLAMIRSGMPEQFDGEVPPALVFRPGVNAPFFWHGKANHRG